MILLPAIDMIDGKAVRLDRGDFGAQTDYDADPLDAAKRWVAEGARALHIVDLDGARTGAPANLAHVERIANAVDVPIELGGGLRTLDAIDAALAAGADSVILGTVALRDSELVSAAVQRHGERVVVSLDARDGALAAAGWVQQTDVSIVDALRSLGDRGVSRFVYSSIERDGMLTGPDLEGARMVGAAGVGTFVYSGGVSTLADLEALACLREPRLGGVIVGKAIYERKLSVGDAQALLDRVAWGP